MANDASSHTSKQLALVSMTCVTSLLFIIVGFPCATRLWDLSFRVNSSLNVLISLSVLLLRPSWKTTCLLRISLLLNSAGMFTISYQWCADFDAWAIGLMMSVGYQTLAGLVLVRTHVPRHVLLHLVGTVSCYMARADSPSPLSLIEGRHWAATIVTPAVICVTVMWYSAGDFLIRKLLAGTLLQLYHFISFEILSFHNKGAKS